MTPEERFQNIEATLASVAESQSRTQSQQEINTQSIARLEASIAATNQSLNDEVTNMAIIITTAIASFDASARRSELAAAAMERLIDALTDRFGSNGHQ